MGVVDSWRAVIDSLSAGYRFLGRRVELILIPIILDIWLWLGPRLSVVPLMEDFVRYYEATVGTQEMPTMPAEVSPEILIDMSQNTNLMDSLVSGSLLHVPSLLAALGPQSMNRIYEVVNPLAAFGLFTGLSILGLLIGVLYMNLLAAQLPLGAGSKPVGVGELLKLVVRQWLMVLLFIVALTGLLFIAAIPVVMGSVILAFVSPGLSSILVTIYLGAVLVVLFYLYFVTAAIVLDDLPLHKAAMQSILVVRNNFLATLLFILLTSIISVGMTLLMRQMTQISSIGIAIAIPVNAYIGSGLVLALFVFYRTRILHFSAIQSAAQEELAVLKPKDDSR